MMTKPPPQEPAQPVNERNEATESSFTRSMQSTEKFARIRRNPLARKFWALITYTPERCRWNPEKPFKFSLALNLLFGFAGTFTVANLYYSHPILNILAEDFGVSQERASLIPTAMQAGYASGLLFLCPLGDVFRRRAFVLLLVWFTATVWLGLCLTNNFSAFAGLSFIAAVTTVTPQVMLPLVGDLAPPAKRAQSLSIVVSGLMLGLLIARLLSGVVTNYTSWRNIYWMSFALQYLILILLWFFMPDYPATNPDGMNYFKMLWSIISLIYKHPILVQACIVGFLNSAVFTSFWTTLTFLLSSPPYDYNSLVIGLFAFIGIGAMCFIPIYSRLVIDRFVPLFSVILGQVITITGVCIGTYTGTFTVAGPVIQAILIDIGLQTSQISNRSAIYSIAPKARNRINTAYTVCAFFGQLTGTSAGNRIYAEGGWISSGSASVAFMGTALIVCFLKGPWEPGWYGWGGGWGVNRRDLVKKGEPSVELKQNVEEKPAIEEALDELAAEEERSGSVDNETQRASRSYEEKSVEDDIRAVEPRA